MNVIDFDTMNGVIKTQSLQYKQERRIWDAVFGALCCVRYFKKFVG